MKIILGIAFIILVISFLTFILDEGMTKSEIIKCNSLVETSELNLDGYYITRYEASMCNQYGIIINAPIK